MKSKVRLILVSMVFFTFLTGGAFAEESRTVVNGGALFGKVSLKTEFKKFGNTLISETNASDPSSGGIVSVGNINSKRLVALEFNLLRFEDSSFYNIMTVYDYFLSRDQNIKPYIGGHLGYSAMTWEKDIVPGFETKDKTASSLGLGARVGIIFKFSDNFLIDTGYQYTRVNLESDFTAGPAELSLTAENYHGAYVTLNSLF